MFGAQEAGASHGQVHPEHTEEQQAADGPGGRHGLSWVGTDGPREESLQLTRSPSSPFTSTALPAPQNAGRSLADRALTWDGSSPHCLRQNELKDVCSLPRLYRADPLAVDSPCVCLSPQRPRQAS